MQVVESLPKRICSKCGSGQFHTWDESISDLIGKRTDTIWIQCNLCNHKSVLSETVSTWSAKSSGLIYKMPEKPLIEKF